MYVFGLLGAEYPETTHACTGRMYKLHAEIPWVGIEPTTFLLWGDTANHCTSL